MNFESTYVDPRGRASRGQFIGGVIPLLAAAVLYVALVGGVTGGWCLMVLLFPALVLHARRLHDMGRSGWLVLAPGVLNAAAIWLHYIAHDGGQLKAPVTLAALAVSAAFVLWGLLGKGKAEANRFGEPAAA